LKRFEVETNSFDSGRGMLRILMERSGREVESLREGEREGHATIRRAVQFSKVWCSLELLRERKGRRMIQLS